MLFGILFLFAAYCYASSLWAWNNRLSQTSARTLFLIFLCFSLLYSSFIKKEEITGFLVSFMFGGYIVAVYTLFYYGLSQISTMLADGLRTQNDFSNANALGLLMAVAILIQYFFWIQKKYRKIVFGVIPAGIVLIITQSRKAFFMLVLGLFLITVVCGKDKRLSKKIARVLAGILILLLLIYAIAHLPIFSGIFHRFVTLFESLTGKRAEDIRTIYRRIGIAQFKETPIFGIGIGNSPLLLFRAGEKMTYLHCNYVELLACGGIVGFIIFYSVYVLIFIRLWKYRKIRPETTSLCIIVLFLLAVMDYGMVSYSSKQQYLYLLCLYCQTVFIRKEAQRQNVIDKVGNSAVRK